MQKNYFITLISLKLLLISTSAFGLELNKYGYNGGEICDNAEWLSKFPSGVEIIPQRHSFVLLFPENIGHLKRSHLTFKLNYGNLGEGYGDFMIPLKDGRYIPASFKVAWFMDLGSGTWNIHALSDDDSIFGKLKFRCSDSWLLELHNK